MNVTRQAPEELPADLQAELHRFSLFSSPQFAAVWQAKAGRPICWTVGDQERIRASLVGLEFGRGPLTRFQAMPDGLPAAVCFSEDASDHESLARALLGGIASHGYAKVFITDYQNHLPDVAGLDQIACETAEVLTAADWNPPDKTLCAEIRKAEREAVQVHRFDAAHHLESFLALLRHTESRLGIAPRYPDDFYARLAAQAARDPRIVWEVIQSGNRVVASHVYLCGPENALYWISCLDKEFSYLKATQYLLWSRARAFAGEGCTRLNLGQTPPESDSLDSFKMKWGARRYAYRQLSARTLLGRLR